MQNLILLVLQRIMFSCPVRPVPPAQAGGCQPVAAHTRVPHRAGTVLFSRDLYVSTLFTMAHLTHVCGLWLQFKQTHGNKLPDDVQTSLAEHLKDVGGTAHAHPQHPDTCPHVNTGNSVSSCSLPFHTECQQGG